MAEDDNADESPDDWRNMEPRSGIFQQFNQRERLLRLEWQLAQDRRDREREEREREEQEKARVARRRSILRWVITTATSLAAAPIFASPAKWIVDAWHSVFGHP